jgi:hypothetical protein
MTTYEWSLVGVLVVAALAVVCVSGRLSFVRRCPGSGLRQVGGLLGLLLLPAIPVLVLQAQAGPAQNGTLPDTAPAVAQAPVSRAVPAVVSLLGPLEQRLQREPDDARGWQLLGRSYQYLGRDQEAEQAFARARALGDVQRMAGSQEAPVRIHGTVMLDPALRAGLAGDETVYIFARALNGPRMPLAVLRRQVSDLPLEFELDDSMAMTPEVRLSGFNDVIVGARISASGSAAASAGDLEGFSGVVQTRDAGSITVTIDQSVVGRDGPGANPGSS